MLQKLQKYVTKFYKMLQNFYKNMLQKYVTKAMLQKLQKYVTKFLNFLG